MNKLKLILSIVVIALLSVGQTYAAATSPTPVPTSDEKSVLSEKLNAEINQLKEKIASRVSELNLVEKRGLIGTIAEVKGNQITLTDLSGKTRFVDVDEITKFSSPSNKNFGLSDLNKGTKVSTLGLYNKQSKRLLARFINATVDPMYVSGTIGTVDTKNFQLTVLSGNKETKVDNQNSTKIFTYEKEDGFAKLGFSKITAGQRTFVMGYPDKTDPTMVVADRIIIIPTLPKNENVVVPEQPAATNAPSSAPARR